MRRSNSVRTFGRREALLLLAAALAALLAIGYQAKPARAVGNTFTLSASTYSTTEGSAFNIVVNRTAGTGDAQVNLSFAASGADPVEAGDHAAPGGSVGLPFTGAETSRTYAVGTTQDLDPEGNETLTVTLSVQAGDTMGISSAIMTIVDDDGPPVFSWAQSPYTVSEAAGSVTLTVNRSGLLGAEVTVQAATSNGSATAASDYTAVNQTVTFPINVTTRTVVVPILQDAVVDAAETFNVTLSGPSNGGSISGTNPAIVNIVDDEGPGILQFSSTTYSGAESGGPITVTVTRTGGSSGAVSVTYASSDGTANSGVDYAAVLGTLNWADGDTASKTFTVTPVVDSTPGESETVILTLSAATGGATIGANNPATLTINDSPPGSLQFTSTAFGGAETGGAITVTVSRTGGSTGTVGVTYATSNGTATAGTDYGSATGMLSWGNGDTANKSFTVTPVVDALTEGSETVILTLSAATGGATLGTPNTATLTITDIATVPTITSISPASGTTAGGTAVTITGTNLSSPASVLFDGLACTSVVSSATQITCFTPAHVAGTAEVVVTTAFGSNTTAGTANDFVYTTGPTITNLSVTSGTCNGATVLTITGTNFTSSGMTVKFGTVTATFNYTSSTSMTVVAPAQGAGVVDVSVTTPSGTSPNTTADDFTCTGTPVPVVTSISPSSGAAGSTVVITGTGFTGATAVTFGGVTASFTVNSATQITATVPAGTPSGQVDIRVTGPGGQSVNGTADNFTNTSSGVNTYTLYFRFTLVVWTGADNKSIATAINGSQPGTTNVAGQIGVIWLFHPQGPDVGRVLPRLGGRTGGE